MTAPSMQVGRPSKVVVACLDGQRLKGFVFNFSSLRGQFRLFPEEKSLHHLGKDVKLESVTAIFFVKDLDGHREHHDSYALQERAHGRKIEVTFQDGEKIAGMTETYHPESVGFFISPADPECNNTRIFVVNKNVREVTFIDQAFRALP
ncbi:MAG: hypothetical protein WBQ64_11160 [Terriglobales bacterium]